MYRWSLSSCCSCYVLTMDLKNIFYVRFCTLWNWRMNTNIDDTLVCIARINLFVTIWSVVWSCSSWNQWKSQDQDIHNSSLTWNIIWKAVQRTHPIFALIWVLHNLEKSERNKLSKFMHGVRYPHKKIYKGLDQSIQTPKDQLSTGLESQLEFIDVAGHFIKLD